MEVRLPPGMEQSPRPHRSSSSPPSLLSPIFPSSFPSTTIAALPFLSSPSAASLFLSLRPPLFPNVRPLSLRLHVSSHPLSLSLHPLELFPFRSRRCLVGLAKKFTFVKKKGKRREKSMRDVDWPHTAGLVPTFVRGAFRGVA